jgi:putative ABC transport system ATP-binding protein
MQIVLKKIVPTYLEKEQVEGSEIWGREVTFNKGEHVHIVAASGTGKTSLVHFMYGLRKDYEGTILYDGKDIKKISLENFSLYRQNNFSVIFQDLRLFTSLSVRENIEVKRQLNPYHAAEKIDEMALRLGIGSKLEKTARTCSYGEQQRIAIIRALMQPFEFLFLDEPFSNLDEDNRRKAFDLIYEECTRRKASMIFADLKLLEFFHKEKVMHL